MKQSEKKIDPTVLQRKNSTIDGRRMSVVKKDIGGILNRMPDLKIPEMNINDEYTIEKQLAEGCFAKILLTNHKPTNSTIVLKAIHIELTSMKEFIKEYHYSYQLSHHPNILSSYQVSFQTNQYYIFAVEYAPFGDLAANVGPGGLPEVFCKSIATQLANALGFMHSKGLVHRDVKLENVLVFAPDFSRVKLCDFGATTRHNVLVNKIQHSWTSFLPPEILEVVKNERFACKNSCDSWQFGILMFIILTGSPPWQSADWVRDVNYAAFMKYQKRKTQKIPDNFRKFTPRLIRAFRKYFDSHEEDRAKVTDVLKYMKDKWIDTKMWQSKSTGNIMAQAQNSDLDSICVYLNQKDGRASLDENRTRLRRLMSSYGLESSMTQVDVKKRICDWVLSCDTTHHEDIEGY